jgi:predicted transcriptional regulator
MTKDLMFDKIYAMKNAGYSETDIAKFFGLTVADLRHHISIRNRDNRVVLASMAKGLKDKGMTVSEIAQEIEKNESSVRLLLDE